MSLMRGVFEVYRIIMKKTMFYLILAIAAACVAAVVACAYVRNNDSDNAKNPDNQGHALTSLWKSYYAAEKADLPKKKIEILDEIISAAK